MSDDETLAGVTLTREQFGRLVAGLLTPQQRKLIRALHERVEQGCHDGCAAANESAPCCAGAIADPHVILTPKQSDPCTRSAGGCICTLRPDCWAARIRLPRTPPWATSLVAGIGIGSAQAAAIAGEQDAAKRAAIRGEEGA